MTFKEIESSDAIKLAGNGFYYKLVNDLNVKLSGVNTRVTLPTSLSYEGAIATLYNTNFPPYTKLGWSTEVVTENGIGLGGCEPNSLDMSDRKDPVGIYFVGGVVQFIAVKAKNINGSEYIKWIALNYK